MKDKRPKMSVFHHKHGTSFAVVPAGIKPEDYWRDVDGYSGNDGESVESEDLPMPYAIGEEVRPLLRDLEMLMRVNAPLCDGMPMHEAVKAMLAKLGEKQ